MDRRKRQRAARLRARRAARQTMVTIPSLAFGLSDDAIIGLAGIIESVRFGGSFLYGLRRAAALVAEDLGGGDGR